MIVFAWIPKGKEIGHAALQLAGHYISPRAGRDGPWTLDDDVKRFGRMPHLALQIKKLDELTMLQHWRRLERGESAGWAGSRGLAAVAETLCAGLSASQAESAARLQRLDSIELHTHFVTYVYAVSLALNQGIPMNLMYRKHMLRRALGQGRAAASPRTMEQPTPVRPAAVRPMARRPVVRPPMMPAVASLAG